jgi:hypothetical protein
VALTCAGKTKGYNQYPLKDSRFKSHPEKPPTKNRQ